MTEGKERTTPKTRIETLSDLIFGLALSIGALTLIGQPPSDFAQLIQFLLFYAFSFLILISVWYGYTRTMSLLHVETIRVVNLNILLLFLVSIEPFLFNQLINPNSLMTENVSILYAFDLGGLFVIQSILANSILTNRTRSDPLLQNYKIRRNTLAISAAIFFISALPFFWSWIIHVNGVNIPVRFILWLIPMFLPSVRRFWERKIEHSIGKTENLTFKEQAVVKTENYQSNKVILKLAGPTGIEPATYGLRVRRSSLTEPRARFAFEKVPLNNIELTVCCCILMQ